MHFIFEMQKTILFVYLFHKHFRPLVKSGILLNLQIQIVAPQATIVEPEVGYVTLVGMPHGVWAPHCTITFTLMSCIYTKNIVLIVYYSI
jgi:hypothetical protein